MSGTNGEHGDDVRFEALIVEDDADFRASLSELVRREGFATREVRSLAEARSALETWTPDVILLDLALPDGHGLELVEDVEAVRDAEVLVVTGHASVDSAVQVLRSGGADYLTKPIDRARLKAVLTNVARTRALKCELRSLRGELRELGRFGALVGRSKPMQEVYDLIARVAPTDFSVLLTGESGTGKELVAETVHRLSRRASQPFVPINCGAVSPNLIESELFGHEKGSFTGAERRHVGVFERAHGGTLLLDEVIEMSADLQVKLLRVLESGSLRRVGGTQAVEVDVRVIAATNRSPEKAVREEKLREDLFYRLNVFPIALPPLRERGEDVDFLAEHFLDRLNCSEGTSKRFSRSALERLRSHPWSGNVRELRNIVQRAYVLANDEIGLEAVPLADPPLNHLPDSVLQVRVGSSIADVEQRLILSTLDHFEGDKKKAAEVLGISLKTLYNRLNQYRASES